MHVYSYLLVMNGIALLMSRTTNITLERRTRRRRRVSPKPKPAGLADEEKEGRMRTDVPIHEGANTFDAGRKRGRVCGSSAESIPYSTNHES